jgi:hypothetical protein
MSDKKTNRYIEIHHARVHNLKNISLKNSSEPVYCNYRSVWFRKILTGV